jgi:DNA-directed RNA polymerase subunit M/transcription elongation factor TFIIS
MTPPDLVCPKCGNKDITLMETSETQARTRTHQVHFYECVCSVCRHVWSNRESATPHKQVNHGQ